MGKWVLELKQLLPCLAVPLVIAACTGPEAKRAPGPSERVVKAVTSPLSDLNVVREKIPVLLLQIKDEPYRQPDERTCAALSAEVRALDEVLGPDVDLPQAPKSGLTEKGRVVLGDAAFGALEGAAQGVIPYRGWVRKLTGAERYSKEVATAIAAGIARRSYLKGIGQSLGCEAPAAPISSPPKSAK